MLTRAVEAEAAAGWVTGDEVYGADPMLRAHIEVLDLGYVLAIGCNRRVPTHGGLMRPDRIAAALPAHCWQRYSAGAGAKGPRIYQWAWVALTDADGPGHRGAPCGEHHAVATWNRAGSQVVARSAQVEACG